MYSEQVQQCQKAPPPLPQYRELHETLAQKTFDAAFKAGVFVGQVRTRLGIIGYESKGPEATAAALLNIISAKN
jgi:hypothetical protein